MCPQKTSHWKGNLAWVKYTKRTQNNITAVTSITSPGFVLIIHRKITQFDTNLTHMIENLHTIMSSFKRIKLLVRQGLPSTLRIRTAESDTDWMFVFPRVHSQHASARSERSCDSTALPTLYFWGWEMAATRTKLSKLASSTSLGYAESIPNRSLPCEPCACLIQSDPQWEWMEEIRMPGISSVPPSDRPPTSKSNNTHFFLPGFIYFLNHTLLQQIQKF